MTVALALSFLGLAIWIYLLLFRGLFWLMLERDGGDAVAPKSWPLVAAIVPARDEAETIARSLESLLRQDYPERLRIILVDDQSSDGTADIARRVTGGERIEILAGTAPPAGWTGKLWALKQGIDHVGRDADYLWLTDADIVHAQDNLKHLVMRARGNDLALVSLMAKLNCESFAERFLIPAFVFSLRCSTHSLGSIAVAILCRGSGRMHAGKNATRSKKRAASNRYATRSSTIAHSPAV